MKKILIRRGLKADLPELSEGELGFCTDTKEVFIGSDEGNIPLPSMDNGGYEYDDTAIFEALEMKSEIGHGHYLNEIYDVDTSEKSDGDTLRYDAESGRFSAVPLPAAVSHLEELADVDFSVPPAEHNVLSFEGGTWKAKAAPQAGQEFSSTYLVELDRWGITQGSFGKPPYSEAEWETAFNNLNGFNEALEWASEKNYTRVVVPKGTYSFCYTNLNGGEFQYTVQTNPIRLHSNMTFDLNASTFEVMFDSENKNPYDLSQNMEPWRLPGDLIAVLGCYNAHVTNGTLIGDIPNRSFSDGGSGFNSERGMEQTYGIRFDRGSEFCSAENIDVSQFMGDGITLGAYPGGPSWLITQSLDRRGYPGFMNTNGQIESRPGAYITNPIPLNPEHHKLIQMRTYGGYTRIPRVEHTRFEYLFFDSSDNLIRRQSAIYLQTVVKPFNASYVRLQFVGETPGLDNINISYHLSTPQISYIHIENCKIYNNHRGGISGGADFTSIEKCKIFHNGEDSSNGTPIFPDSTRYQINFEDSYSNRVSIRDCQIFSGFHSLLLGAHHIEVTGCIFSGVGNIHIYNNAATVISNNFFNGSGPLSLMNSMTAQRRNILVTNNVAVGSHSFTTRERDRVRIIGNTFITDSFNARGNVELVHNYYESISGNELRGHTNPTLDVTEMKDNTFVNFRSTNGEWRFSVGIREGQDDKVMTGNRFINCSFISVNTTNHMKFTDTEFIDCIMDYHHSNRARDASITFERCLLENPRMRAGTGFQHNTRDGDVVCRFYYTDSKVVFREDYPYDEYIRSTDNIGQPQMDEGVRVREYELYLNNTKIEKNTERNVTFFRNTVDRLQPHRVFVKDCDFNVGDPSAFRMIRDVSETHSENVLVLNNCRGYRPPVINFMIFEEFSESVIPVSPSPPVYMTVIKGSMWFNEDQNKLYIWNGEQWISALGEPLE
ncbi:hypothetical protein CR205_09330 [Alteribacter lacisalsi]|uniref:Major tropism determinant N-terminal domain-containing protein n=1 Tax=Alteribacter lacisalsi TaxID=2045244 RepID=A0A2W0HCZ1_9BACI|nr:right-handed parallel beta-helix repeat-containing protein [Alteribacter lacisalsi]PYZ98756.1 hypothetical protein CR205_09330 [Alteribacter lacisalsi]